MTKLDPRRIPAFLADPGEARVALLHGDDAGLVRERADALIAAVTKGDALCLTDLSRDAARDPRSLVDAAAALPLMGGRMLVRVRDAGDGWVPAAKLALAGPGPGLVLLEGGELPNKSKLRQALEPAAGATVVACYRERGRDLAASISRILGELGVRAEPAALEWLAGRLGDDRMLLRRELEKLALYVGPGGTVDAEAALACVAEGSVLDLEEAIMAALTGDVPLADRALDLALADGAVAVQVVRATLRQVQRLHLVAAAVAGGAAPREAVEALKPPVFFRHKPAFEAALRLWRLPQIEAAGAALLDTERRTKTTGLPSDTVARQAVLTLARQAAARR